MIDWLYSIAGFLVAVGVLVTVHEYGHFWVARRVGVKVLRFSVGFGRPVWSGRGKDGTEYVLASLPLGGYVKMLDESEGPVAAEDLPRAFNRQPLWRRAAVVLAGPAANLLFAVFAYAALFASGQVDLAPEVGRVDPESLAAKAGFEVGERIVEVDGRPVRGWGEQRLYLINRGLAGDRVEFRTADREGGAIHERQLDFSGIPAARTVSGFLGRGAGLWPVQPTGAAVVARVLDGSPAAQAGLQAGDRISAIDGRPVPEATEAVRILSEHAGRQVHLELERDGKRLDVPLTPRTERLADGREVGRIGIALEPLEFPEGYRVNLRDDPFSAVWRGGDETWQMSVLLVRLVGKMLTFEVSSDNISGPITIAVFAGRSARLGAGEFVFFLAMISITLGIMNLLPIPVLDGGHLLYYIAEAVRGGPLPEQVMLRGQQIGILLLSGLMLLAFWNDAIRWLQ
ncbi:MAG: RIP metalloprotease RseP [Gammaproteobacteria bacterium]|nr:RIP metalloprotease RseP [Gammaproteobacteria bacterium]